MRTKFLMGVAMAVLATATFSTTADAADATGNASAVIREAITVTEATAMDFATITADPAGDTITLTTAGAVSADNTSVLSGSAAAGEFDATGTASSAVSISFSSGDQLTGPGAAMNLNNLAHSAGGSPAFDGSGDLNFNVGGELVVNASQVGGSYAGTYTVTVDYQ